MLPFEGGVTGTQNGTLLLSVLLSVAYLLFGLRRTTPLTVIAKTLSVALLAGLSDLAGGPWLLTLGLALCAAGDFFLAIEGLDRRFFLAGLVSFLAGHLAYVALFLLLPDTAATLPAWIRAALLAAMAAGTLAMAARLWPAAGDLRVPVMVYVLAILAMGIAAAGFGNALLAAGAASFMVSDSILAAERFLLRPDAPGRAVAGPAVWITYYAAQAMILFGVLAVPFA
ncbi:lysoplasmalogenase [Oricola thermophila]|uniref:Lysoplasmalogenase n=1 Tax=Oricola thermophila TaxID=2742145 RepID=A0A6N1VMC0_9HYPH|nr:lysoplasmalogenase [Oricola thermophila]QKV20137.1 lysoplasmalogenase [Oricola thermophila]